MKPNRLVQLVLSGIACIVLATGATSQQAASPGPSSLSETYDAWTVQCVNTVNGNQTQRNCQMSQEILQQESRQRVLLFAIARGAEDTTKATLVAPFGLLLSEGLRIELADKELVRGVYRTCLPAGCIAEIDLPEDVIEQLQTADKLTVVMTANTGQPVRTDLSLAGFAAAYKRLVDLVTS